MTARKSRTNSRTAPKALEDAMERLLTEGRIDDSIASPALLYAALGAGFALALVGDSRTRALLGNLFPKAGKPGRAFGAGEPDAQHLRDFLQVAWLRFGGDDFTVGQAIADARTPGRRECAALHSILVKVAGDRGGTVNARRLGHWLRAHAGLTLDSKRIERGRNRDGAARWRVEVVAATGSGS